MHNPTSVLRHAIEVFICACVCTYVLLMISYTSQYMYLVSKEIMSGQSIEMHSHETIFMHVIIFSCDYCV